MYKRQQLSTFIFCFLGLYGSGQVSYSETVIAFQDSLNELQRNTNTTQLLEEDRASFQGLNFFPINSDFVIEATLELEHDPHIFKLTYSNDPNVPQYMSYGTVHFTLKAHEYALHVYQNVEWMSDSSRKNFIFLPFKDWTNGPQSYGGGRFIWLCLPDEGNTVTIDFNKSFNPPCAYNYYMACPLIPESNQIETEVLAGIMTY